MISESLTIERVKELHALLTSLKTDNKVTLADIWTMTVELDDLIWTDMQLWHKIITRYETQSMQVAVFVLESSLKLFMETAESVAKLREQYKDEPEQLEEALNSEYIVFMSKLKGDIKVVEYIV